VISALLIAVSLLGAAPDLPPSPPLGRGPGRGRTNSLSLRQRGEGGGEGPLLIASASAPSLDKLGTSSDRPGASPSEVLQQAGIDLSGPFTPDDLAAFTRGLAALPAPYRRVPSGRIRLVLDATAAPTATGIAEPEWSGDDFLLTLQSGHVTFRDETLTPTARTALWRSRALIHALLARWDDVHHWSRDPRWRRINGWILPFERPLSLAEHALNEARTAYARPRGQLSSRLDFLTFAETALVPVESVPLDEQVECQEFSRLRALGALLGTGYTPRACPAFDAWHRPNELEHLEVLFVQASGRAPESLFGHLLVRPVWRSSAGPSFETAVQFAAITLPTLGPAHLARGMFGGYGIGVFTISMTDLTREKLSGEQRTMTRWKLALSADEQRRFLERTWELERRGRFAYAFFSDNCASVLVWMLETSLDEPKLVQWPAFITSPGGVLDDLFRARRSSGERLLTQVFPSFEATGVLSRRAEEKRRALEVKLASLGVDFSDVHGTDVERRRGVYQRMSLATRIAPASLHQDLFTWWATSARIERASADEARHELREKDQYRLEPVPGDLETLWDARLTSFERETQLQQNLMMLDRETFFEELRQNAKKRPLTPGEEREAAELSSRIELFTEVAGLQADLSAQVLTAGNPEQFLADEAVEGLAEEVPPSKRALPVSGHWRTGVGGGVWRLADGSYTPVVRLEEAGLLELLGEQRLRGLGASVGVRMLEGGLTLAPARQVPEVVQSHFTLVAFDSIAPPLPPVPSWRDHLGFGFELATDFRSWRSLQTMSGGSGWAFVHARADQGRHLLALGVGPSLGAGTSPSLVAFYGGGSARLVGRLGLPGASGLRLEARYQALYVSPLSLLHEVRGDASLEWAVSWGGSAKLLVRPTLSITAEPARGRLDATALLVVEPAESFASITKD
jgi:hypothetical protein